MTNEPSDPAGPAQVNQHLTSDDTLRILAEAQKAFEHAAAYTRAAVDEIDKLRAKIITEHTAGTAADSDDEE
ncbi:MAG: hypothetical protein J2P26_01830 [Nocardiopsaceae bacterium]|nr:hypothetical protein [Nocardiopsaceae bacterium]